MGYQKKGASKIVKNEEKKKVETFNKNHEPEIGKAKGEPIKSKFDGKDTFGV